MLLQIIQSYQRLGTSMSITDQHITGFVWGLGAAALGYYWYRKNQTLVDEFLRSQGIDLPAPPVVSDPASLSLEALIAEKERLEDLIAEREQSARESSAS